MEQLIIKIYNNFENMAKGLNHYNGNVIYDTVSIKNAKNDLINLSIGIKNTYPFYSNEIFSLKDKLFYQTGYINPVAYGKILIIIKALHYDINENSHLGFWAYIHPIIIKVSQQLYLDTHYSKAVQAAFVEINARVKRIRIKIDGTELDGPSLMMNTFNETNPKLSFRDNSTESGRNIQEGNKFIFAGVMKAIRNPNAHENVEIEKDDAVRKLILASLLMHNIDEAVIYTGVTE
ncbi:MAG: TIGR02391 family protein [Lachnospiraceae bacterium]|nr:TIGR02391 family protein [Lachnospiraceae bacterium]